MKTSPCLHLVLSAFILLEHKGLLDQNELAGFVLVKLYDQSVDQVQPLVPTYLETVHCFFLVDPYKDYKLSA